MSRFPDADHFITGHRTPVDSRAVCLFPAGVQYTCTS